MASAFRGNVGREIDRVFHDGSVAGLTEAQLLRRFAARRDESAFEALVARHGPMVLGVCRRVLRDPSAVDDAFQATFLILVRKAGALRDADRLGPWLYGVAARVAARARSDAARRRGREQEGARPEAVAPADDPGRDDLRGVLDEEIGRLPEKYRTPVVLCYLEGSTQEEAARTLRLPAGVLRGRLDRARDTLRPRLVRRGLAPAVAAALGAEVASAAVPPALLAATVALNGSIASSAVATSILTLADGVLRTMFFTRFRMTAALLAGASLLVALSVAFAIDEKPSPPPGPVASKAGLVVEGRVLDRDGRPIAGARVARGADPRTTPDSETTTDAEGRFAFLGIPPGELILTVEAKGYAPALRQVEARPDGAPVVFRLAPGRTLRGRIVDPSGQPIAGAPVAVESWRGRRSLRWNAVTDADGRFRWDDAPADEVTMDLGTLGFSAKRFWRVTASSKEETMPMRRPLRLRGSVVDAATGKPVERFTVLSGPDWGDVRPIVWRFDKARTFAGGSYDLTLPTEYPKQALRIEAEGYEPAVSRAFKDDEREVVSDFKLQRGGGTTGVVRTSDGLPLAGAEIVVATPEYPAFITNGLPPDGRDNRRITTGADGRFAFPKQPAPFTVVVLHEKGFAAWTSADATGVHDLTVRPWGRVEGTVRVGAKPGAGLALYLQLPQQGDTAKALPWYSGEATADASGHFAFDRVIPGKVTVSRKIQVGPMSYSYSHAVPAEVAPGATARVTIGGTGRPVVGRVTLAGDLSGKVNWDYSFNWLQGRPVYPTPPEGLDAEARLKWRETWMRSDEAKAMRQAQHNYAVKVAPDGTFRVDDVEAGTYDLLLIVHETPADPQQCSIGGDVIGSTRRAVTVAAIPGGRTDEPIDLGATALEPVKKPKVIKVADPAPAFRTETLDGKPLALADYRGKVVLLDFWATWCGPCLEQTPDLKAVYEAFGKDGRFALIGLSLDRTRDDPRRYAEEHGLAWTQGFLGDWSDATLPEEYGVTGIPSLWLIGPDGTVLAKDLRGPAIQAAVAEALARPR